MSHTIKPGNLDSEPENDEDQPSLDLHQHPVPWRIVVLGVVALLLAVYIGTQVLGVLFVIVFPPAPPLPADVALMSHTSTDYGVDEWLYHSRQSPCEVITYYRNSGGECQLAVSACDEQRSDDSGTSRPLLPGQNIATCTGVSNPSIFAMRWKAIISAGSSDKPTEFQVTREMFWTGQAPPIATPELP